VIMTIKDKVRLKSFMVVTFMLVTREKF
jgi:hypothetical protein